MDYQKKYLKYKKKYLILKKLNGGANDKITKAKLDQIKTHLTNVDNFISIKFNSHICDNVLLNIAPYLLSSNNIKLIIIMINDFIDSLNKLILFKNQNKKFEDSVVQKEIDNFIQKINKYINANLRVFLASIFNESFDFIFLYVEEQNKQKSSLVKISEMTSGIFNIISESIAKTTNLYNFEDIKIKLHDVEITCDNLETISHIKSNILIPLKSRLLQKMIQIIGPVTKNRYIISDSNDILLVQKIIYNFINDLDIHEVINYLMPKINCKFKIPYFYILAVSMIEFIMGRKNIKGVVDKYLEIKEILSIIYNHHL